MKFFIIAGEASGDVHGANLAKELLKLYLRNCHLYLKCFPPLKKLLWKKSQML